jgi:hypothetical protein
MNPLEGRNFAELQKILRLESILAFKLRHVAHNGIMWLFIHGKYTRLVQYSVSA